MANPLKNHPFAVSAHFDSSIILTFSVDKNELIDLIPQPLTLDLYLDKWAFITVAMVDTKNLRPKAFPKIFGNDFFLIGYRIFVRYKTSAGRNLRGLYILKSETNKKKMEILGNIFTNYNYQTIDLTQKDHNNQIEISSKKSNFNIVFNRIDDEVISLPEGSIFPNWKEARKFVGPMPFTFQVNQEQKKVLIIEGLRDNWKSNPIQVQSSYVDFINRFGFKSIKLANAFEIIDVDYDWKKGVLDTW